MASLWRGDNTNLSVFLRSIFPRCAISASLSFPDNLGALVGGGGGGRVVDGTAGTGAGVVN